MAHPMMPGKRGIHAVNLNALEDDMNRALAEQRDTKPPNVTAEMALQQYEAAAGAIAMMGDVVKDRITSVEASLTDLHATMKIVHDAALAISNRGEAVYNQIEEARNISEEIRTACAEFVKKIGA